MLSTQPAVPSRDELSASWLSGGVNLACKSKLGQFESSLGNMDLKISAESVAESGSW